MGSEKLGNFGWWIIQVIFNCIQQNEDMFDKNHFSRVQNHFKHVFDFCDFSVDFNKITL